MPDTANPTQLTIRRTLNAPIEKVFDAWINPEHLKRWWRAQRNLETISAEVDLRIGGEYRLGMRDPAKEINYICHGKFLEIIPEAKLVYTWSWRPPAHDVGETVVTIEFRERGDSTELLLTHERLPTSDSVVSHTQGWNGALEMFVEYLVSI